jgi:hypothetical protein
MRLLLAIIIGLAFIVLTLLMVVARTYNYRNDNKPEAAEFRSGHVPEPPLNGSYKGNAFTGMGESWLGKQFDAGQNSGINNFRAQNGTTEQRYSFTTSLAPGLRNKTQEVLRLNYDVSGNPLWLRFIRDEVVEIEPGHYIGKIHLKLGFIVITIGYFRLAG